MNEYKIFVQRIGLVGFTNILIALSSIILLPILTKNFSTSDYGIWVQISTTISLIPNIAMLGLPMVMVRYLSIEKEKKNIQELFYSIVVVVMIASFIISFLFFLFSEPIADGLFNGNIAIAKITALMIFIVCLNILFLNFFRTYQQMKIYSLLTLAQTYIGVLLVSYYALSGLGIFNAALGLLITYILMFIIMLGIIISQIGINVPKFRKMKEHLLFSLPTIPSNISSWIVDSSDRYIIGLLLGTVFVGYYAPGYTLGNIVIMILAPFSLLLPSVLPQYYEENNIKKVTVFLNYSLKYFLLLAIPTVFGLSMLSKPILMILTNPEIAINSYFITPFVALSALLFGIYGILSNIFILIKKTKIIGITWIIVAILNICLNFIFVPYFGIIGAAAITLISYALALGLTLFYTFKFFKFEFDIIFIIKSIIASITFSFIIIFISPEGLLNLIFVTLVCSIIYFILIILFKCIKKEEIKFLKSLINP